jgi:hypothetical protein
MNGQRSKSIRSITKYNVKTWRNLTPKDKYHIERHIKIIGNIKYVSLQLWCRGSRRDYQQLKEDWKNENI